MNQDDPEVRIAALERQLAEQKDVVGPRHPDKRPGVTPEDVRTVAFSDASRSQGGYHRDEVDAFVDRIEATLRDPTATGGVTPADIHDVAFCKPPIGKRGYNEGEVDAFLDRVKTELTRPVPGQGPEEPIRCLLYRYGGWDPQTPVLAIDVVNDAIRVIDLNSNALIASASLGEVTAEPAQYGGGPVLVVGVPGLQPLTIRPHLEQGFSRRTQSGRLAGKVKAKKPDYVVTDADWLTLVDKFPVELPELSTLRKISNHILRFLDERGPYARTTWRTPLLLGLMIGVPGCIYWSPKVVAIGAIFLILAALAWRFKWEL